MKWRFLLLLITIHSLTFSSVVSFLEAFVFCHHNKLSSSSGNKKQKQRRYREQGPARKDKHGKNDDSGKYKQHNKWSSSSSSSYFHETGILYRQSILTTDEIQIIRKDYLTTKVHLLNEAEAASASHNRLGVIVPETTKQVFQHGSPSRFVRQLMGDDDEYILSKNIPVEFRVYEKTGASMDWHVDDVLYDPHPQIEIVFTLENTSNCQTRWKHVAGDETIVEETLPNSILLLKAGGVSHCVTPLKRGRRVIVKCAYVSKNATFRSESLVTQFASTKTKQQRKKTRRRRKT